MSGSVSSCETVQTYLSNTPQGPASSTPQGTLQQILYDLLDRTAFNLGIGWLKAHVGFQGNEMADVLAKYCSYALRVQDCHRPPPFLLSITFACNPVVHKIGGSQRKALYPRHQHTGMHKSTSFYWSTHYSWCSSFADEWVMGVKGVCGTAPQIDLADRHCPDCNKQHPLDLASCGEASPFLQRMADCWGPTLAPPGHTWLQGNRTCGELRNCAGTLVPTSLYRTLAPDRE